MIADKIYYNGKIHTMVSEDDVVEAIAIYDGKIVAVGTNDEVLAEGAREKVDLEGKTVFPGLIDTHMHLFLDMQLKNTVSLHDCYSIAEVLEALRGGLDKVPEGLWFQPENFFIDRMKDGRWPTRQELDSVSTEIPIVLGSFCHHFHVLNTKALELCGIDADFKEEIEGQIWREEDGFPNGVIRDQAYPAYVLPKIPQPTLEQNVDAVADYFRDRAREGLTTLEVYQEDNPDGARMYLEARRKYGNLMRCGFTWYPDEVNKRGITTGFGDDFTKMGPLKFLADGSCGGRTAFFWDSYPGHPDVYGTPSFTQDELDALVKKYYDEGFELCIHAIGDRTIDMVLEAYEKAYDPEIGDDRRFYIAHCTLVPKDYVERAAKLPVFMQQSINWLVNFKDFFHDRFGEEGSERANRAFPLRDLIDAGVKVQCGSDAPVATVNPWVGIECAVTRKAPGHDLVQGGAQAITVYEALLTYTKFASYYNHDENKKGTLEVGKFADFIVTDRDPFAIDPRELHTIESVHTVLDGKVVYEK